MATVNQGGGRLALGEDVTPTVISVPDDGPVQIPGDFALSSARMLRAGDDLVVTETGGAQVIVRGYFESDVQVDIVAGNGAQMAGELVSTLAGPRAPGQVAQAGSLFASEPIGEVDNAQGDTVAVRVDGTRVTLRVGDPVFQGDVLETGADGTVGIVLADDTSFSMAADGRMVLDEMIYDPATQEGSVSLSVVQGLFSFVSGQIAKTDPDAMTIETPVATIGIRGTQVGVDIADGINLNVTLMEEADGFVGEVTVQNDGGVRVLNGAFQFTVVSNFNLGPAEALQTSIDDMVARFGDALSHLPVHQGSENTYGLQDGELGAGLDALNAFDTAAGGDSISAGTDDGTPGQNTGPVQVVDGDYTGPAATINGVGLTTPDAAPAANDPASSVGSGDGAAPEAPEAEEGPAGNQAPVLAANSGISVEAGEDVAITSSALQVTDVDDAADEIVFTLLDDPDHGELYLGGVKLSADGPNNTFTQFDIDHGLLGYEAEEPEPFTYSWSDGTPEWDGGNRAPVDQANLTIPEGGEAVTVTFEGESAGYHNAIGWYKVGDDGQPTDPQFIWADASLDRGILPKGTTVTLEGVQAGEEFGLFIIQNGANRYRWLEEMVDAQASFSFDEAGGLVAGNHSINPNHIFYTGDADLNPDGINHAKSGMDGDALYVGFEDLTRGGDNDFNDLMVSVRYEGSPQIPENDSFRFVVTDGTDLLADIANDDAGYTVTEGEGTFSIVIEQSAQVA